MTYKFDAVSWRVSCCSLIVHAAGAQRANHFPFSVWSICNALSLSDFMCVRYTMHVLVHVYVYVWRAKAECKMKNGKFNTKSGNSQRRATTQFLINMKIRRFYKMGDLIQFDDSDFFSPLYSRRYDFFLSLDEHSQLILMIVHIDFSWIHCNHSNDLHCTRCNQ